MFAAIQVFSLFTVSLYYTSVERLLPPRWTNIWNKESSSSSISLLGDPAESHFLKSSAHFQNERQLLTHQGWRWYHSPPPPKFMQVATAEKASCCMITDSSAVIRGPRLMPVRWGLLTMTPCDDLFKASLPLLLLTVVPSQISFTLLTLPQSVAKAKGAY